MLQYSCPKFSPSCVSCSADDEMCLCMLRIQCVRGVYDEVRWRWVGLNDSTVGALSYNHSGLNYSRVGALSLNHSGLDDSTVGAAI